MVELNEESVRKFFPILGRGVIYFDNAASSLTPEPVLEKMLEFYHEYRANIHRGAHHLAVRAGREYEEVYHKLARFFNAGPNEFVNVRNTTEAINTVALSLDWRAGDEVVTTNIEHHSNLLPWIRLAKERGVKLKFVNASREGAFDLNDFTNAVSKKTRLVAFTACSNVLGNRMPVKEITRIAHDAGALALVDAAQVIGHKPVSLKEWDADFVAFSGHKCFAPTGAGVLFHKPGAELKPLFVGGGTVKKASFEDFELLGTRERFEAGTPAIAEWIGLGAAIDFLDKVGVKAIEEHDALLVKEMFSVFQDFPDKVVLYGPTRAEDKATPVFAFNVKGMGHHEVAVMFDELKKICVRSGHHCAIPLTRFLGVEGTVRASLHAYNTREEIRVFKQAMELITSMRK